MEGKSGWESGEEDESYKIDFITNEKKDIEKMLLSIDLKKAIRILDEEERDILRYRYILNKTQSDVALELGISQVQVSRKEKRILDKLKVCMNN